MPCAGSYLMLLLCMTCFLLPLVANSLNWVQQSLMPSSACVSSAASQALQLLDDIDQFNLKLNNLRFHLLVAVAGEISNIMAAKRLLAQLQQGLRTSKVDDMACGWLIKDL